MNKDDMFFGGIEAGGTKFVCAVSIGNQILSEIRLPTTTPDETLARVIDFFMLEREHRPFSALGVAAFGPIDINNSSETFGFITNTPKPGWVNTDIVGILKETFHVPVGFDTDVNGAALGEYRWGAGRGLHSILYLTIGTGIGGGAVADDKLLHGLLHPEMGHIRIPHNWVDDPYEGFCKYHKDCFEGLACGPAIEARWNTPSTLLSDNHIGWKLEAQYIALALVNYTLILSPQKIIIGGGVMDHPGLYENIREEFTNKLNGYIQKPEILLNIETYIVPPTLGRQAGVLGAIALAQDEIR